MLPPVRQLWVTIINKVGMAESRTNFARARARVCTHAVTGEVGGVEDGGLEVGAVEAGAVQVRPREPGPDQVRLDSNRTRAKRGRAHALIRSARVAAGREKDRMRGREWEREGGGGEKRDQGCPTEESEERRIDGCGWFGGEGREWTDG